MVVHGACSHFADCLRVILVRPQYDYGQVMGMSFDYYAAERVGHLPANYSVPWRSSAFMQEGHTKVRHAGLMFTLFCLDLAKCGPVRGLCPSGQSV